MTNFFNSRSGSVVKTYHYYVTSDKKLHDIGLASYTRNSIEKFGKRKKNGIEENDPDINEYLSGGVDSIKPILRGDGRTLIVYRFDKDTKRYLYTTNSATGEDNIFWTPSGDVVYTDLKTFQDKFDLYQKGWITNDREAFNISYIWSKINTSLSGCISFQANGYSVLSQASSGIVNMFLQSKGDGSNRGVAFQTPVIAGVASTAGGIQHAFNISENLPPGAFSAPDVGGAKNPNNTVAGPLNLHLNRGTGKWESGTTQTYCQILDDVPGVPLSDLPSNVDNIDNETLKLPFTSGIAMVMETEKGNPHLCVPCSMGCSVSEKHKITVVNRTPRAFVKGEVILASQINGDWVPVPLTNGVSVAKKLVFEWSQIQKYIVNAKGFFRNINDTGQFMDREVYADTMRARFYNTLPDTSFTGNTEYNNLGDLRLLNLAKAEADKYEITSAGSINMNGIDDASLNSLGLQTLLNNKVSYNYMQFFDADIIGKDLGGNNLGTKLKNTVIAKTEPTSSDGVSSASVPTSWGLYFPDGYSTASVGRTIANTSSVSHYSSLKIYTSSSLNFAKYRNIVQTDQFNLKDMYFYHMPAQMALNGSGNQSIDYQFFPMSSFTNDGFCDNMIRYIQNPVKGDWLKTSTGKNLYGLTPINSTSVQFTPLSLELALSSTRILDTGLGAMDPKNGGYKKLKTNLNYVKAHGPYATDDSFFGKAWDRLLISDVNLESDGSVLAKIAFGDKLTNFGWGRENYGKPENIGKPFRGDRPDGGPDLIPTQGNSMESSNVVGIIAAKATFSLVGGGAIELKTNNKFGMLAYKQSTMANSSFSTVFGGIAGLFIQDNSGLSKTSDNVQWGGSLGDEKVQDLGTTALWCAVYDHCPNTIYDGRYFAPLQFNPSGASVDFDEVNLSVGRIVGVADKTIPTIKNKIRRNMLLSNGGFAYVKKVISANPASINIKKAGQGYSENDKVVFKIGGKEAVFLVSQTSGSGGIGGLTPDPDLGVDAYGETADGGTSNPFKSGVINGVITTNNGKDAVIELSSGKVIEKLLVDKLQFHGYKKVTPSDANGKGDSGGFVYGNKTTTFSLPKNSTGKYDLFFFFVSDIANYPEGGVLWEGASEPQGRYVNLEITTI